MGTKIINKIVDNDRRMRQIKDSFLRPVVKRGRGLIWNIPRLPGKTTLIKNLSKKMEKQIRRTFLTVEQLLELWEHRTDNRAGMVKLAKKFGCHLWTVQRKRDILLGVIAYHKPIPQSRYKAINIAIKKIIEGIMENRKKIDAAKNHAETEILGKRIKISSFLGGRTIVLEVGDIAIEINRN